jgi:F0F1-type ATP synthase assembly protein I
MSQGNEVKKSGRISYPAGGMAIGLIVGGILGLLIDNLAFSAGGGMILGLAIGLALEKRRTSL